MITQMTPIFKAKLKYFKGDVYPQIGQYSNGRIALQFMNTADSEPAFKATINLPDVKLTFKEIIIKDYSENVGMVEFLQENKIIGKVLRYVKSGFVNCPVAALNIEILNECPKI